MVPEQTTRPQRPPTIRSVATRAGVSKSLVSLVLQGSPRVSDDRRRAVLAAMDELGYRPDPAARSLAERRTRTVGVVVDDLRNPWFVDVLDGLRPLLHEAGLRPLLADGRTEPAAVRALVDLRVDGLVVVGTLPTGAGTDVVDLAAAARTVPTVVAGAREPALPRVDVVANDDPAGVRLAVEHLLGLGHRRVGHLAGSGLVGALRRRAYEAALQEAGLAPEVAESGLTEAGGHDAALALLRDPARPSALLAANDMTALGALAAADELGLRVPADLSVVGYDDTSLARLRRVALTSVDNASSAVGAEAGRRLLRRLAGGAAAAEEAETVLLPPRLVVRATTAAPPLTG